MDLNICFGKNKRKRRRQACINSDFMEYSGCWVSMMEYNPEFQAPVFVLCHSQLVDLQQYIQFMWGI